MNEKAKRALQNMSGEENRERRKGAHQQAGRMSDDTSSRSCTSSDEVAIASAESVIE